MIGPILFLDIDGVLNHHVQHPNKYSGCCANCVAVCNALVQKTTAKIVLVSAWRYFVLRNEMTVAGIGGLLCTHGLSYGTIADVCGPDKEAGDRAELVIDWLRLKYGIQHKVKYLILDDMDLGYSAQQLPFVQVNGLCGLKKRDLKQCYQLLGDGTWK